MSGVAAPRRRYDSPLRRQQVAETRSRIVAAGAELLHDFPVWSWHALTVRAVAERAGVNTRTVYRYFASERELRDAVFAHLERESGVDLDDLRLDNLQALTARLFAFVSTFPLEPRTPRDPTLLAADQRMHDALHRAVDPATEGWSAPDRGMAAAMLDVLWSMPTYERLVGAWGLDPADATRAVTWVMGLVEAALATDSGIR
jgi:AcrR family transcriptional regulator